MASQQNECGDRKSSPEPLPDQQQAIRSEPEPWTTFPNGYTTMAQQAKARRKWPRFRRRHWSDDDEPDWWFAGTAIPLIAAAIGPLANVLSIAALVTSWRMCLVDDVDPLLCSWNGDQSILVGDLDGHALADPRW